MGTHACTLYLYHFKVCESKVQSNSNGSNTFGTMKICSRQGEFEPLRVYYRARSGGINRNIFSIFFNMKVYCVYSLESPERGDSNKYTQYSISQYKKEIHPKLSQICNHGICSKGPKNEFESAVVNEPSVFEPLKFYCMSFLFPARMTQFLCEAKW